MRRRLLALAASIAVVGAGLTAGPARAEGTSHAGGTHTVTFDKYSLKVDGKRVYLWAGEFHYWRLPSPDLWRDVLEKMKAAGYNAATIYFDWGYHSPAPGVYDFNGVRDVDKLLDIAAQVGIWVIARPGPYINAETDGGGFPAWLDRVPAKERSPDPDYLRYSDEWLTHIDRILRRHQLTNGTGTIILDQVENEFYDSSPAGEAYMKHLVDKFRADGITVPLTGNHNGTFNSGEGQVDLDGWDSYPQGFNCSTPDRWRQPPDYTGTRATLTDRPLYFPEYQGGAFDPWGGPGYAKCRQLTGPDFEKVFYGTNIAAGSTMQSFYMTYGGTSWGYLPYPGVYTSYDYGAALDESRQLTDKYAEQKLIGSFLAAATPTVAETDLMPAAATDNPAVWLRGRVNPTDHGQVYVLRHADGTSTARDQAHVSLDLSGRTGYSDDDADPALAYTGAWTHHTGEAGNWQGTESWSDTAGDSVTVAFHGTAVRWIAPKDGNHGIAAISLDGQPVGEADGYAPSKQYQAALYSVSGLADGDHTLTLTVTGRKNPAASGTFVNVDAIDVPPAGGEYYPVVPQQPGTALTLNGRDAKLLLANWDFGGQHLVYSTSQLLTTLRQDGRDGTDIAVFHAPAGEDGETVLRYASRPSVRVVSGAATATWDASRGDLRLNYTHQGLTEVRVTGGGRPDLDLLLTDSDTATRFSREDTAAGPVLVRGPLLVRHASAAHGTLALTGDTDASTPLTVWAPAGIHRTTWNGRPAGATLAGPAAVTLPALTWKFHDEAPERDPAYDDSGWTLADRAVPGDPANGVSSTPVLDADDYGYHHGDVWYRGHFTATGAETGVYLTASTGNSTGQYAVWLNGTYLGVANGAKLWPVPAGVLRPGQDNVVSALVANMGHDEGTGKAVRGLTTAKLYGSTATLTWRIQGDRGGEQAIDPVRGPMNNGGLYGERAGWSLPGYPDGGWQPVTLPATAGPGVGWYRSTFSLDLPADQDVPVALRFADDPARHYRVQVYLNGWNLGLYINDVGPQHDFVLPAGLLRTRGQNTLALAAWSADASGGLGQVSLVALGNHRGGVPVRPVDSPRYDPRRYAMPAAPGTVTLTAPDTIGRGATAQVTATVTARRPVRDASVTLKLPDGWTSPDPLTVRLGHLRPGRPATAHWTVTAAAGDQPWDVVLSATARLDGRRVVAGHTVAVPPPAPHGDVYVSDLPFQSTNGWGPVERDTSNGEAGAGDGHPITLGGVVYPKGLGAHAPGDITVYLGGACTSFTATVGIDAEANGGGSVRFHVLADGVEVASTPVLTGRSTPLTLTAPVTGATTLDLVLDDGGDGNGNDHSDWAAALLHC